ncbi:MAG: hypothetical protein Q9213_004351 [Squamulea squamosa]
MKTPNIEKKRIAVVKGFLDLPAKARREVYCYLLVRHRRHWVHDHPEWLDYTTHDPLKIKSSRTRADPTTLHCWTIKTDIYTDEPLYPEILSTCSTICREATRFLYSKNSFSFEPTKTDLVVDSLTPEAANGCKELMSFNTDDWAVNVPSPLRESTLAAFIRKIGRRNASLIRSIEISSYDTAHATEDVTLATVLSVKYLLRLEAIKLYVHEKEICWDESPDYYHPDESSPFWTNGPFQPMYEALQAFVAQVYWLKTFEYDSLGQQRFDNDNAIVKLEELQDFVTKRTEEQGDTSSGG